MRSPLGISWLLTALLVLAALPLCAFAQPAMEESNVDMNQEYERKSMTFYRMFVTSEVLLENGMDRLRLVRDTLRNSVEMQRFDYLNLDLGEEARARDVQTFVRTIQEFVLEHREDLARGDLEASGEGFDISYGDTIIDYDTVRRILDSAYVYEIRVNTLTTEKTSETSQETTETGEVITLVDEWFVANARFEIEFFHLHIADENFNAIPMDQAVRSFPGSLLRYNWEEAGPRFFAVDDPRRLRETRAQMQNEGALPATLTDEQIMNRVRARAAEQYQQDVAHSREMAWQNLGFDGGEAVGINNDVRNIPEFKLRARIQSVDSERVSTAMGRNEDIYVDEWFRVIAQGEDGNTINLGWVLAREVGPGQVAAGEGMSQGRQEPTYMSLVSPRLVSSDLDAAIAEEYPTAGGEFLLGFGFDLLSGFTAADGTENTGAPHVLLGLYWGLGRAANASLWSIGIFVDASFGTVSDDLGGGSWLVWGAGLEVKKSFLKRYGFAAFFFTPVLGLGFGTYQISDNSDLETAGYENGTAGSPGFFRVHGNLLSELFLHPRFRLWLNISLRVFAVDATMITGTDANTGETLENEFTGDGGWKSFSAVFMFGFSIFV